METMQGLFKPELIWFLVGFFMLLVEFAAPGIFFVFFAIGAWIVAIACLAFDIPLTGQLFIFLISSVLTLLLLRKKFQTIFTGVSGKSQHMPADEFIGEKALVKSRITPEHPGKVEFHGSNWTARADESIEENVYVEITGRSSLVLNVKKIERS